MHKKGHCKFKELKHDIFMGIQTFTGYPHRRHRKQSKRLYGDGSRREIYERIKQEEFNQALNNNDENL